MSDVPVCAIVNLHITDPTADREHEKGCFRLLERHRETAVQTARTLGIL